MGPAPYLCGVVAHLPSCNGVPAIVRPRNAIDCTVFQVGGSMNRLVRVSSIRLTRKESEADISTPALEAAIGLHAMYNNEGVD